MLLIGLLAVGGVYAFALLPKESNPEVKIPIAIVTTMYPGASPYDVEELVTKKIETSVSGLKGISKITSNSSNSFSSVRIEFDPKENLDDSIRRVRDKVSGVKNSLPADVKDSIVNEISLDDQPIWTIVVTGPYDGFTMRKYSEDLKSEMEKIPGVRQVNISGGDEKEFEVAYDPQKLLFYNVSAAAANSAIVATNLGVPAGNFDGDKFVYPVRTDARIYSADEIGNIPVSHTDNGGIIYVKDLAAVKETAIKKTTASRLSIDNAVPQNAVTLSIVKRTGSSIIDTVNNAKSAVDAQLKSMPAGIKYDVTQDHAKLVNDDFNQLTHDFILTLILVFGILFLTVGAKEGFVASLAIPLVFFITFICLWLLGMSLNFLSMFSLILALGLLVDDAIVVVSATKQYLRTGKFTPEEAVLLVLNDFKVVLTTTTLTTVWAFLPLLFSSGIMGEYIKSIPITVSITLIASLFVALMINHPLAAFLERIRLTKGLFFVLEILFVVFAGTLLYVGGLWAYIFAAIFIVLEILAILWYEKGGRETLIKNSELAENEWVDDEAIKQKLREQGSHENVDLGSRLMHGIFHLDGLLPIYEKYLKKIIATKKSRLMTLGVTLGLFLISVALPVIGVVQSEFFPVADSNYIYVGVRAPVGQKLEETDKTVKKIEEKLLTYKEISNFSTVIGRPGPTVFSYRDQSNLASITVNLKDAKDRKIKSYDLADKMRKEIADVGGAVVTVETAAGGPPAGSAFEAHIKGDDLGKLNEIAYDFEQKLNSIRGVVNADISLKDSVPDYTFVLDPIKMEQNSVNAAYVGSALRMAISGSEISTVIKDNKEIKIIANFGEENIPTLEDVQNLQILNLKNQPVFLKDVAIVELKPSVDTITRIDQKRTIILTAGTTTETNSNQVLGEFKKKIADYEMPAGYSIDYGGQNEQNADSVMSIVRAMVIAMLLIVSTLIIQFNSFRKALIILVTIPLALIGVFLGMAVFNVSLSFPGLIGILALFGIVVKNAIILVDKINLNIKSKIPFEESVIDAGKSRLEAIFITSICTISGILPITLSNEMWRSLGGAVIFGLSLSSFFTLFIVPTLYVSLIKEKDRF
jgi:HAE1 family hydrophobic/amphiphilic exporter-1